MFIYSPPADTGLSIVYQDDRVLALSKPSGLLSVPGRVDKDCLEARTREQFPSALTIHRLDLETSGVMVYALDAAAQKHINLQFEQRRTAKRYIARVWGNVEADAGVIDQPMRCDWPNRPRQIIDQAQGKSAQTAWRVLDKDTNTTRVELKPVTGRSHQLRVHMQFLGHPILRDSLYAEGEALTAADRLQLHAEFLQIHHPDDERPLNFFDPCPF